MSEQPDKEALVLCGHSNGNAVFQALPKHRVVTGGASYGQSTTMHQPIEIATLCEISTT